MCIVCKICGDDGSDMVIEGVGVGFVDVFFYGFLD